MSCHAPLQVLNEQALLEAIRAVLEERALGEELVLFDKVWGLQGCSKLLRTSSKLVNVGAASKHTCWHAFNARDWAQVSPMAIATF